MKTTALLSLLLFCLVFSVSGQPNTASEEAMIEKFIKSRVIIEKEKIVSPEVAKIFYGTFHRVKVGMSDPNGSSMCSESLFVIKDGKLIEFDSRTDSILTLLSLVKKEFLVKSETDAKIVEKALEAIYPLSSISGDENKELLKIANKWYFIRGKFFDSKSGYIVTLDQNSRISNIAHSMEAIKK